MKSEERTMTSKELRFSSTADRDKFEEFITELSNAAPDGEDVTVEQKGEVDKPDGVRGLFGEVFLILAGTAFLVKMIQTVYDSIRLPGGTRIDLSQGGRPIVENDPTLPNGSVLIIAKDGTVEYKPEESAFSVLMSILKAVLVAIVSGGADGAKAVGETVKNAVTKEGGDDGASVVVNT